jgi:hypothetical protein
MGTTVISHGVVCVECGCLRGVWLWRATSAKMVIVNESSNKSGKSVGAVLRMAFECLTFVIMAKM